MEEVIKNLDTYTKALAKGDYTKMAKAFDNISIYGMSKIKSFTDEYCEFNTDYIRRSKVNSICTIIGAVLIVLGCIAMLVLPKVIGNISFLVGAGVLTCTIGIALQFMSHSAVTTLDIEKARCITKAKVLQANLAKIIEEQK